MLKLKLQYFGHLVQRADSFEKTLMLGKIEGRGEGDDRGWDVWIASLTQWTWVWVGSRSWCWTGRPGVLQFTGSQRVGHDWMTELNWMALARPLFWADTLCSLPGHPYPCWLLWTPSPLSLQHGATESPFSAHTLKGKAICLLCSPNGFRTGLSRKTLVRKGLWMEGAEKGKERLCAASDINWNLPVILAFLPN